MNEWFEEMTDEELAEIAEEAQMTLEYECLGHYEA